MATTSQVSRVWSNHDFRKVWFGQTVSFCGSQVSGLALPLTATLVLDATPTQMGWLTFAGPAPYLLLGLVAGVWIDRLRRRPLLIGADLGRALLLGLIPLLSVLGWLRIEYLIVLMFLVGTCTLVYDLAYQSFLPTVLGRHELIEGNSRLWTSRSAVDIGGPGLAGLLIQLLTPLIALLLDAASFLVSAGTIGSIRTPEPHPAPRRTSESLRSELMAGLRYTVGNALLRAGAFAAASYNFGATIVQVVLVLYVVKQLGVSAGAFGLMLSIGAVGSFAGAILTTRAATRWGIW